MIRIAIFADLHGNLPALNSMLKKIQCLDCDFIYSLGDSISMGPYSNECLDIFRLNNIIGILGNHEEYLLKGIKEPLPEYMSRGEYEHQLFVHSQVSYKNKEYVKTWPYQLKENIENCSCTLIHSPFAEAEPFNSYININNMNLEQIEEAFADYSTDIVLFGHTHSLIDFYGAKRYINPGSVGCHKKNYARFSVVEFSKSSINVHHYQEYYDKDTLMKQFAIRNVPERDLITRVFF